MMNEYRTVDLGGGVTAIEEGAVRMFLIRGTQRAVLLDTGLGGGDLQGQIKQLWDGPLTVVNTHGHVDHVGANGQFPQVLAHPADWAGICEATGCGEDRLRPLRAGDAIELGDRALEVLETPGHTAGSIVLLDRARRILFGGDNVSERPIFLFLPGASLTGYLDSMRRLLDWSGAYDTIYACHGTVEQDASQVQALIACCEAVLRGEVQGQPEEPYCGRPRTLYQYGSASIYGPFTEE